MSSTRFIKRNQKKITSTFLENKEENLFKNNKDGLESKNVAKNQEMLIKNEISKNHAIEFIIGPEIQLENDRHNTIEIRYNFEEDPKQENISHCRSKMNKSKNKKM